MSSDDKMTMDERRKYLRVMKKRYVQVNKKGRGQLLDQMEAITGLHRKSLIRLLKGSLTRKRRRKQRKRTYKSDVDDALRVIAESSLRVWGFSTPSQQAVTFSVARRFSLRSHFHLRHLCAAQTSRNMYTFSSSRLQQHGM